MIQTDIQNGAKSKNGIAVTKYLVYKYIISGFGAKADEVSNADSDELFGDNSEAETESESGSESGEDSPPVCFTIC